MKEPNSSLTDKLIKNQLDGDEPESTIVARRGIKTSKDFAEFMSSLMGDLVEGRIDHQAASAACYAGDMLLKVVKMQIQHGRTDNDGTRTLPLTGEDHGQSKA